MPGFLISKSHIRFARFNKRETFKDNEWLSGLPLWELTANFGFQRLQDGRCQVYHHGEVFVGPFPFHLLFLFFWFAAFLDNINPMIGLEKKI